MIPVSAYSDLVVSPTQQSNDGNVIVSFDVKNVGDRAGDEIPQMYLHELVTDVTTYEKNLRGFTRLHLQPGEKKRVAFTITPDDLAIWNLEMKRVVEPGKFKVMIGPSSKDIRFEGEFEITK